MSNCKAMQRCGRCRKTKDTDYFTRLSIRTDEIKLFKSCNACEKYRFIYRNKESTRKARSKRVQCECGSVVTQSHLSTHKKTNKHLRLMIKNNE